MPPPAGWPADSEPAPQRAGTLGKDPLTLEATGDYLRQLRGLLHGDVVDVDGEKVQMCQLPGYAPTRPIEVPLLLSALGPKGQALAHEVADGVMTVGFGLEGFDWSAQLVVGTVLDPGEPLTSPRVKESAGPWYAILAHGAWESLPVAADGFPAGTQWRTELASRRPEAERHLAVHEGHATTVTDLDRILVEAAGDGIVGMGWVSEADGIRTKLKESEAAGSTEIIFAPSGPDIERSCGCSPRWPGSDRNEASRRHPQCPADTRRATLTTTACRLGGTQSDRQPRFMRSSHHRRRRARCRAIALCLTVALAAFGSSASSASVGSSARSFLTNASRISPSTTVTGPIPVGSPTFNNTLYGTNFALSKVGSRAPSSSSRVPPFPTRHRGP